MFSSVWGKKTTPFYIPYSFKPYGHVMGHKRVKFIIGSHHFPHYNRFVFKQNRGKLPIPMDVHYQFHPFSWLFYGHVEGVSVYPISGHTFHYSITSISTTRITTIITKLWGTLLLSIIYHSTVYSKVVIINSTNNVTPYEPLIQLPYIYI